MEILLTFLYGSEVFFFMNKWAFYFRNKLFCLSSGSALANESGIASY